MNTKLQQLIAAILKPMAETEAAAHDLELLADIDLMGGVNLDAIGVILGQSRVIPASLVIPFFGFYDQWGELTYGEETDTSIGGVFYEEDGEVFQSTALDDDSYRLVLKAAVVRNYCKSTCDDVLRSLSLILNSDNVYVENLGYMHMGVGVGFDLTYTQQVLLKNAGILPRPSGVTIEWISMFDPIHVFGFDSTPNATGFSEDGDTSLTAPFAEEF